MQEYFRGIYFADLDASADGPLCGIDIDGVRILFNDGWGLVRASNTQPSLVTRFEAKTQARCDEIKNLVLGKLQEFGKISVGMSH